MYLIPKGQHYSRLDGSYLRSKYKWAFSRSSIRFTTVFGEGCNYKDSNMGVDREDINKLYGMKFGFDTHYNSVRIGWRYNPSIDKIELYLYSYVIGKRVIEKLTQVNLFEEFHCTMFLNKSNNRVIVEIKDADNKVLAVSYVPNMTNSWVKFRLFPYFGGNLPAPNKMKIFVRND